MTLIEEIGQMMREGRSNEEISILLQQRGFSPQEIRNAFSQAQIKEAVSAPSEELESIAPAFQESQNTNLAQELEAPLPQAQYEPSEEMQLPQSVEQQNIPSYQQEYDYSQSPQMSTDTITEIAEQIVSEKLSNIRVKLDKAIDTKTITEGKLTNLSERLQRIEKIIDTLQLSLLQKVGEYAANVSDLKKEVIETQKSFKSISSKPHHHEHHEHKHKK